MYLRRWTVRLLFLFVFAGAFLSYQTLASAQLPQGNGLKILRTFVHRPFRSVCDLQLGHLAACDAKVVTESDGATPLASSAPLPSSLSPLAFHTAYQIPCMPGGSVSGSCPSPLTFTPIVAIVDAYHTPNIENDLNVYSNYFGIPSCTKANGCLRVVNENGGNSLPRLTNSGWALETSLDVEVAHAICQTCQILLVEASSNSYSHLATAVATAARLGAVAISNSYGSSEWSGQSAYDSYYRQPGVAVTVSSGDGGYGPSYPAAANGVIAVGGTTLQLFGDLSYAGESVWSGTGSGCSQYESANVWQSALPNWAPTYCGSRRGISDISADADPNSGAAVYDSTPYSGQSGWWQVGGTSLSSPIIASIFALANNSNSNPAQILYANAGAFHDVTDGSNGSCAGIMCMAGAGYDGPTGLGTPNGISGFIQTGQSETPTPTSTNTPTPIFTPSATPMPTLTPSGDNIAPSVNITSPSDGARVSHNHTYTIKATASDNIAVKQVNFSVDGQLLSSDTSSPYKASWRVPAPRGVVYQISATAVDTSGNTATATISVTSR